jgi:hypothetical protein
MALTEYSAKIQQTASDPMITVHVIASREIAGQPREQAESQLSALLHQVRIRPELVLYSFRTVSSYEDPLPTSSLFGHNTLVEISLPYTLHLPSDMPFDVTCPEAGRATVVIRKVWTDLAAGSNTAEIYSDDHQLYYGPAQLVSPTIPQARELGPWPHFTGTNLEIAKDTHGVFRYTQIHTFFDSTHIAIAGLDTDEAVQEARSLAYDHAMKTARDIVNYLLDVYRYVTSAEHVERLSAMNVRRVYFADHNLLFEEVSVEGGLGSAIVNRSGHEIARIREMLLAGAEPERHVLLMQSARAALNRGQLVLAVVVAFQSLEILLETKLRVGYAKQGLSDADVTDKLKRRYRTKDRLTVLCREVTSGSSVADDTVFWNSWLNDCNHKRNGVVHKNESVTYLEALRVVELCEQCIARLLALPFPP